MKSMAKPIGKLKDGREVFQNCLPLNAQIEDFYSLGIKHPPIASPDDVALIRIEGLSDDSSRTSMMPVRASKKPTILTRISGFMAPFMADVIMDAHRQGNYPDIFSENSYDVLHEKAKTQLSMAPEDREVHILEGKVDNEGKFFLTPEMDDAKFIFRNHALKYFEGRHTKIPFYDLPDVAPKGKAIANYLWLVEPQSGSGLYAWDWGLDGGGRAFGVRDVSAEGASQNFAYTLTNIGNASKEAITRTAKDMEIAGIAGLGFVEKASKTLLEILRKTK
jgi:hypothetical protein